MPFNIIHPRKQTQSTFIYLPAKKATFKNLKVAVSVSGALWQVYLVIIALRFESLCVVL
jgi:hypothetical protein